MKKVKLLTCIIISVLMLLIACVYFIGISLHRYGNGEEYAINWICPEYGISFTSYDEIFPYKPNEYKGQIFKDKKKESIIVNIEQGNISFGVNGEPYTETYYNDPNNYDVYSDFEEYASGRFDYDGKTFTVSIIKANKEYSYLLDKKLVFKIE